ncbi:glycogen synthase GlgA [Testudinibacter sp. TR-2022]|uniref:glycogen synthase GlgA n=1 Tax=Testudinibacter sp. TR-2022 TaxID=2585029 RepID=UPI00111BA942|nr:glycogen synthase GlgA [Testudinibacter sp. TR-2022]TNH09359.1 glycogen synthase GlgA [Pasteurellaceae bacterium Phil11]TNH25069.1 glycogen synthase GlgA [Testudinibacter sp. TR-2022]TNH29385.1 glycogen synthase GlgA [Testudinibacter sp. TR-2022]
MNVLHVCSELYPLLKTGGLADVTGALPFAQQQNGDNVRILIPAFPAITAGLPESGVVGTFDTFAGQATLRYAEYQGLGVYLIDAPHLYQREGNPYHDQSYHDYADNYLRFALLAWFGAELGDNLDSWWKADVVHAHDWHAGLACAYLHAKGRPAKSVFTIHNLAYQGQFNYRHMAEIALPLEMFNVNGVELNGQISYLKAGLYYADHVTAVSPTYAQEITTPEYAYGLQGLLTTLQQQNKLSGVLNGVDYQIWNPELDSHLPEHYKLKGMSGKAKCKAELQQAFNLPQDKNALLFVMVTRLTAQKGVDLLLQALPRILKDGVQFILLGSGDKQYELAFSQLELQYPQQVSVEIGYNEKLSHLIIAGGDVILVPSRFEPCGLTQLYGLKYGTLPLVRSTGGLADTVVDCSKENLKTRLATGFVFNDANVEQLVTAFEQAQALWHAKPQWYKVRINAMEADFSWHLAAEKYSVIYQNLFN